MEVWFNQANKKIKKAICTGHVKAIQGPNVSFADKMIYEGETQLLTMIGRPEDHVDAGATVKDKACFNKWANKPNDLKKPLQSKKEGILRLLEAKNLVKVYGGRRVVDGLKHHCRPFGNSGAFRA